MRGILAATAMAVFAALISCLVVMIMHPERFDHPGRPLLLVLGFIGSVAGLTLSCRFLDD
jgi:hypothetical protein